MAAEAHRYAVIGNPVAHSLSPEIHAAFAEQTHQALTYERLPAPLDGFAQTVTAFFTAGGQGVNVTVPFKAQAYAWVDTVSDAARRAGAVNTIVRTAAGGYRGENTDGVGLLRDLQVRLGWRVAGTRTLILGAGGAVQGVAGVLLDAGVRELVIANRTESRAQALIQALGAPAHTSAVSLTGLSGSEGFDLVINATSAALSGATLPLSTAIFAGASCYDMVYGAAARPFLELAQNGGANATSDGLGMLVEQAAEAFYLWRGVRPVTAPVFETLNARVSP